MLRTMGPVMVAMAVLYAAPAIAGQKLPVVAGTTLHCTQQNNDTPTHSGNLRYAWDFSLNGTSGDADLGLPVTAVDDGIIVYAKDYNPGVQDPWGNCVIIKFADGQFGMVAHLEQIFVKKNESVKKGQAIATLGNANGYYVNGAHVHYQRQSGATPDAVSVSSSFDDAGVPVLNGNYESQSTGVFDSEFNSNGGSGSYGTQQNPFGTYAGVHWHYNPFSNSNLYRANNLANNGYVQNWAGSTYSTCGIVYDALGGARRAYTVRNGFYHDGHNVGWNDIGGPTSNLGMPITNEYPYLGGTRQDFQTRYLRYQQGHNPTEVWSTTYTSPGWTSSGWNNQFSYLMAMAYDRNGKAPTVGSASGSATSYTFTAPPSATSTYYRQAFSGGSNGAGAIFYHPDNAVQNSQATNEAYYLYGNFWTTWNNLGGANACGVPTRDWYMSRDPQNWGNSTQYKLQNFMRPNGEQHYMIDKNGVVEFHSSYTCMWYAQNPASQVNVIQGSSRSFSVQFQNTGTTTWSNDPNAYPYDYVQLKSCDQNGVVGNSFLNSPVDGSLNWIDAQTPCTMTESSVAPGQTATFTFTGKVASSAPLGLTGVYFRPSHSVGGLMDNWGGMYFPVNVIRRPRLDFDGDGKADIVFLDKRDTGYLRVDYTGNGIWPLDASYPNYGTAASIWACPGDFNGDHIADFAQINPAYSNGYLQINYGPVLVDGFTSNFDNYGTGTLIPVVADFNGDGYDDYSQFEPATGYWRINYGPDFASGFELMLPNYGDWGFLPCAGDFDGDGKADLLMLDRWHGIVYINYASNGFTSGYDNLPGYPNYGISDWIIPMAGDVNGDGYDDYVQYEMDTGYLRINYGPNIANGFETHLPGYPTGPDVNPLLADFDGDGKADLMVYNKATWTVGIDYAANGLGAIDIFRTYFNPDGSPAQAASLDQGHRPPELAFRLWAAPNPATSNLSVNFTLPVADWVTISIYDVSGREVAKMPGQAFGPGQHAFAWAGKNTNGQRVGNGIYFARFNSHLHQATMKLVVVK